MIVLLEGPDGVGKTYAQQLLGVALKPFSSRLWHADQYDRLSVFASRLAISGGLLHERKHAVWDRAHLGELVYGRLDRNQFYYRDAEWLTPIEAYLIDKQAHCFLLDAPLSVLERRRPAEGGERLAIQRELFRVAAHSSWLDWEKWVDTRVEALQLLARCETGPMSGDPLGMGTHEPDVWLLGEQLSRRTSLDWPFVTRSGLILVWPVVNPHITRVSNALPSDTYHSALPKELTLLRPRWEALGKPAIVTLGHVAYTACQLADLAVDDRLPHPQYWLRFHAHEPEAYRSKLANILGNDEYQSLFQVIQ